MPELPEVEMFRRYIHGTAMGKAIGRVEILDKKVVKNPEGEFKNDLQGRKFTDSVRVGKYLFMETGDEGYLLFHFGMTGHPELFRTGEEPPRHTRVAFHFEDGSALAFRCPRKFGRLEIIPDLPAYQKAKKLGHDALELPREVFDAKISRRKAAIKAVLMDQSIAAGVGNWIADEILYQARIHPEKRANTLSESELDAIFDKLKYVCNLAVEKEAHFPDFPPEFMIHSRWTDAGRPDAPRLNLEKIEVGGRSTYFDPSVQKL